MSAHTDTASCYFDTTRYGWVRYGIFFPYEVWGNGPFFYEAARATSDTGSTP